MKNRKPNTAVFYPFLLRRRGAEAVLAEILLIYPESTVYTFLINNDLKEQLGSSHKIIVSYLNNIPFIKRFYKVFIPFIGKLPEKWDMRDVDLLISVNTFRHLRWNFSKGTKVINYNLTIGRALWDLKRLYSKRVSPLKRFLFSVLTHSLRIHESETPRGEVEISISKYVQKRIIKYLGLDQDVIINPPVSTKDIHFTTKKSGKLLCVSQYEENKGAEDSVRYAIKSGKELLMVGYGSRYSSSRKLAKSYPNIHFLKDVNRRRLVRLFEDSSVLLMLGYEDWGITAVEAIVAGTPVICMENSGTAEIVEDGKSGRIIESLEELDSAITECLEMKIDNELSLSVRQKYNEERFRFEWEENVRRFI